MRLTKIYGGLFLLAITVVVACHGKTENSEDNVTDTAAQTVAKPNEPVILKGIYSFAPGAKLFQFCGRPSQFWAVDSSAELELKYSQIYGFEQSGSPVYAEVEGYKTKSASNGDAAAYDSTLVVKKVIKITKDIPADCK